MSNNFGKPGNTYNDDGAYYDELGEDNHVYNEDDIGERELIEKDINELKEDILSLSKDTEDKIRVNKLLYSLSNSNLYEKREALSDFLKKLQEKHDIIQKENEKLEEELNSENVEEIKRKLRKSGRFEPKTKLPSKESKKPTVASESYKNYEGEDVAIMESPEDIATEFDLIMGEIEEEKEKIERSNLSKKEKSRKLEGIENAIEELNKLNTRDGDKPLREEEAPGMLRAVWEAYKEADFKSEIGDGVGQAVHHLNGYNWDVGNRISPDNLILLSHGIHNGFHDEFGYGNNSIEQFLEFLYTHYPNEAPSFVDKYIKPNGGLDNIDNKLKSADDKGEWGNRIRRTQFNRSRKLPVLKELNDLSFKALTDNIPYSSFFLKNMEVPIDGSYDVYGREYKSAQLSTSDRRVLDIYDSNVKRNIEKFSEKTDDGKYVKSDDELRGAVTARRLVESLYGLYTKHSSDELSTGSVFKDFSRAELLEELLDSHNIGRERLEKRVNGELLMPFLDGKYQSDDFTSLDVEGIGSGLFVVLDKLKKFFETWEDELEFENPLKDWDSKKPITHGSKNEEILEYLFKNEGLNNIFSMFTYKLPVSEEVMEGNDRTRLFKREVYEQEPHSEPSMLDKYDDAHKDLMYLLGISRRGFNEETIARYFTANGRRNKLSDEDDVNAIRMNTKPNGKGVKGTVNKPETDTSKIDSLLNEINGVPTHVTIPGGLALAQELQKYSDELDFVQYLKPNQQVNVEGTKPLKKNNDFIALEDVGEFRKIAGEINNQITTLRIAIYRAIKTLNSVFGESTPSKNNRSTLGKGEAKQIDRNIDEDVEKYKKGVRDSKQRDFLHRVKAGDDVERLKEKFGFVDESEEGMERYSALSYEELVGSLKEERKIKQSWYDKTNASIFKKRVDELDVMLGIFEDLFNKGDPTTSQQAFSDIQNINPYSDANNILGLLNEISEGGRSTWDSLQNFRASVIDEVNDSVEWINSIKDQSQALFGGDVKSVMFQSLDDAGLINYEDTDLLGQVIGLGEESQQTFSVGRSFNEKVADSGFENSKEYLAFKRFEYLQERYSSLRENIVRYQSQIPQLEGSDGAREQFDALIEKIEQVKSEFDSLSSKDFVNENLRNQINEVTQDFDKLSKSSERILGDNLLNNASFDSEISASNISASLSQLGLPDIYNDSAYDVSAIEQSMQQKLNGSSSQTREATIFEGRLTRMAYNFNQASQSANQFSNVLTKLFAIVGTGNAVNDMITASSLRQTNEIMLASRRGMEESEKLYDRIQKLVVELPGNDTFLTNILTMLGTMDESLSAEDLEYMGGVIADYYMGAQAKGQFNNETERELRNYLMTGQTRNLTNSIIASEVESLKNLNTVKERTIALEKALQKTGMDSIAHYDSYKNTLEEFKGRFQKSFADLGDLYLGFLKGLMDVYNFLDSISGSLLSQITIVSGVAILGALSFIAVTTELLVISASLIEAIEQTRKFVTDTTHSYNGLVGKYRELITTIAIKIGIIDADTVATTVNTGAKDANAVATDVETMSIWGNITSRISSIKTTISETIAREILRWEIISGADAMLLETIIENGNISSKIMATVVTMKQTLAKMGHLYAVLMESNEIVVETVLEQGNTASKLVAITVIIQESIARFANSIATSISEGTLIADTTATLTNIASKIWSTIIHIGETIAKWADVVATNALTVSTWLLNGAIMVLEFLLSPLGLIIIGIVGGVWLLVKAFEVLGQAFGWWTDIGGMFGAISDGIRRAWEAFKNNEVIQTVTKAISNLAYTLGVLFNWIWNIPGNIWQTIFGVDNNTAKQTFDIVGAVLEVIGAIGKFLYYASGLFAVVGILNSIGSAIGWLLDTWNEFTETEEFQEIIKLFQEVRIIVGEAFGILNEAFAEVHDAFMSIFQDDESVEESKKGLNVLLEVLKAIAVAIRVMLIPLKVVAIIFKGIALAIKTVADLITWVIGLFTNTGDYFNNFMGMVSELVNGIVNEFASIPSKVVDSITSGVTQVLNVPFEAFGGMASGVLDFVGLGGLVNPDNGSTNLVNQKQLAQNYNYNNQNRSNVINNNFHEGSVQADARNMTSKDVHKLFTGAFGYNEARGTKGILN